MKKLLKYGSIFLILLATSCSIYKLTNKDNKNEFNNNQNPPKMETEDFITKTLNNMTLEEKIGQMMIVYYREPKMDETLSNILKTVKPGGFIFFKENLVTYNESLELINNIKESATIPMFLSIDQEGGKVDRLKTIKGISFPNLPSATEIGATNDTEVAYGTGAEIAHNLKIFGFNMNFAPVLDIYSNSKNTVIGTRSFGSNADLVSKMGLSLSKGLQDNDIIPVYKHFPGHGNTETDSHVDLPIVSKTKEELLKEEIVPFKNAIDNGAEVIMIGHLAVPSITNSYIPASLSKKIITNLLKEELNYKNIVITDALNMKALTNNYSEKEIIEKSINAGVDILLMPEDPIHAITIIKDGIKNGTITEEQINTSVKKILSLKYKYNIINE